MESPAVLGSRGQVILQVSTTFFPDAKLPGASKLPDVLLYSKWVRANHAPPYRQTDLSSSIIRTGTLSSSTAIKRCSTRGL